MSVDTTIPTILYVIFRSPDNAFNFLPSPSSLGDHHFQPVSLHDVTFLLRRGTKRAKSDDPA